MRVLVLVVRRGGGCVRVPVAATELVALADLEEI